MFNHESRVPLKWGSTVSVFFFGDLQSGQDGFSEEAWEQFKAEFKSTPNAYAIGLGDYGDWLRPSMRSRLYGVLSHDDSARHMQDNMVRRDQDKLLNKYLSFLEGKLIGLHDGHHQWDFADGSNSTQRLCTALRATYLGWMASTRLVLTGEATGNKKRRDGKDTGLVYTMISMHGSGSARHATTDSRWLDANIVPAFVADLYAKGHGCKNVAWSPFSRQHVRRKGKPGLDDVVVRCLNVGGFSKGYTDGWSSSYVERAGFSPQAPGWALVRFKWTQPVKNGKQLNNPILDIEHMSRLPHGEAPQY